MCLYSSVFYHGASHSPPREEGLGVEPEVSQKKSLTSLTNCITLSILTFYDVRDTVRDGVKGERSSVGRLAVCCMVVRQDI